MVVCKMKVLNCIFVFIISLSVSAEEISKYRFYQTDNIIPEGREAYYAAFIKNDNPCIFVKDLRENKIQEYCKMGESGLDLKNDYPSIYPSRVRMTGTTLYFIVAAPWNEQKCKISFPHSLIQCESTGK